MAVAVVQRVVRLNSVGVQGACRRLLLPPRDQAAWRRALGTDPGPGPAGSGDGEDEDGGGGGHTSVPEAILEAALPHVPTLGWSRDALAAGARSLGLAEAAHGLFPGGGADLVHHFLAASNGRLAAELRERAGPPPPPQLTPPQRAQFVRDAVELRLRMVAPYAAQWPQALALMALPPNLPRALASLLTLVDDICYYAGDRSVDFGWYTQRVTLAGIYKASELYLIQDKSEDFRNTWSFLERCIDDTALVQRYLLQSQGASQVAKDTLTAAFDTARNILGLNVGSR